MGARFWVIASVLGYAAILALHAAALVWPLPGTDTGTGFRAAYGLLYFLWSLLLLGTVARAWPGGGAPRWRPLMLATATTLAWLESWVLTLTQGRAFNLDTWMVALLGIALAAILPRLVPEGWLRYWLGQERRRR